MLPLLFIPFMTGDHYHLDAKAHICKPAAPLQSAALGLGLVGLGQDTSLIVWLISHCIRSKRAQDPFFCSDQYRIAWVFTHM